MWTSETPVEKRVGIMPEGNRENHGDIRRPLAKWAIDTVVLLVFLTCIFCCKARNPFETRDLLIAAVTPGML